MLDEYIEGAKDIVQWMADNAALLSVAATLLLFFLSKKKENGLKIYETIPSKSRSFLFGYKPNDRPRQKRFLQLTANPKPPPPKKEKTRHLQQYIEPVSAAKIQLPLKKLRISAIIVVYLFLKGY